MTPCIRSSFPSPDNTTRPSHSNVLIASPILPFDILYSVINEVILDHLHTTLVAEEKTSWNAFTVLPLVSSDFHTSCQTLYVMIFGLEGEEYDLDLIQKTYATARYSWFRARGSVSDDTDEDIVFRYKDLMARKSLIQIYICLAYARRYFNFDIYSPLFYRHRTTLLPEALRLPEEEILVSSKISPDEQSDQKMKDDKMHRLFMPMTCAIKLCDVVSPSMLVNKVARYISEISPYCATVPVLLKYVQDIESYINNEYDIEKQIQISWILQTFKSIDQIDTFFQQFRKSGRLVFSFMDIDTVPRRIYEIVGLRHVLEQSIQIDWSDQSDGSRRVRESAGALVEKLESLP